MHSFPYQIFFIVNSYLTIRFFFLAEMAQTSVKKMVRYSVRNVNIQYELCMFCIFVTKVWTFSHHLKILQCKAFVRILCWPGQVPCSEATIHSRELDYWRNHIIFNILFEDQFFQIKIGTPQLQLPVSNTCINAGSILTARAHCDASESTCVIKPHHSHCTASMAQLPTAHWA